jgi:hypothetical protein
MNPAHSFKLVSLTPPAAIVDAGAYTTAALDTRGYDYCTIVAYLGASDIAMAALKVQESDTDGSYGDVTGLVYGTSLGIDGVASDLPSATDDNKFFGFEIDLRGRKRFLDVSATAGDGAAGTFATLFAILWRGDTAEQDAASRGFANILRTN